MYETNTLLRIKSLFKKVFFHMAFKIWQRVKVWRDNLLLFSYFAFADKNMKSQCRNHLFFSLNFFKP